MRVEVSDDGLTFAILSQDGFPMTSAGSGEQQLVTLLSSMGPMKEQDAQEWMNEFLPRPQ